MIVVDEGVYVRGFLCVVTTCKLRHQLTLSACSLSA